MNPGTFAIIIFQLLVLVCASWLMLGANALADYAAISAYFFLVVGIVLQAAKSVREKQWEGGLC